MTNYPEIIHHRCLLNDGGKDVKYLDHLYNNGIRSYEFDLFDFGQPGICIGHPSYIEQFGFDCKLLYKLLNWSVSKKITFYFDIKFPNTWETPIIDLFEKFKKICRSKLFFISYDLDYFFNEAIEENFICGSIMDNVPGTPPLHPIVLPISKIIKQPEIINLYPSIIASEVNTTSDLELALHFKLIRLMSDNPIKLFKFYQENIYYE